MWHVEAVIRAEMSQGHLGAVFLRGPSVFLFSGLCSLEPGLCFLRGLGTDPAGKSQVSVCVRGERGWAMGMSSVRQAAPTLSCFPG